MLSKKKLKDKKGIELSEKFTNWVWSQSSLIVHTIFFLGCFILILFWVDLDQILLVLTTVVSLEAIYLAIFIQMTVNRNTLSLKTVESDISDIQEGVDEIQEGVDEIQEDVELLEKDIDEIQEDVELLEKDIDEIRDDIDEIQEDGEEGESENDKTIKYIEKIEFQMQNLVREINELKNYKK